MWKAEAYYIQSEKVRGLQPRQPRRKAFGDYIQSEKVRGLQLSIARVDRIISNRKKSEACNRVRAIISNRKKSEACNNTTRQRTRRPSIVFFGISPLLKPNPSPRPGGETRSMTEHQKGLRRKWQKSNPKRPHTTNRRPRASDSNRGFLSRAKSDSHSARASDSKIVFCVCARSSHAQAPGWTPAFAGEGERRGRGKENRQTKRPPPSISPY